jgi:hypothetical protein
MLKKEVIERIKGLDEETQRSMVCAMVGHSNIVSTCFGQVVCLRCGSEVGDTLMGTFNMKDKVIDQHDCSTCRGNYKKMNWTDKFMTPNPFKE